MAEDDDKRYERRGFNPFKGGYTPLAPPGYDPATHKWAFPEPGGARTGVSPAPWHRTDKPQAS